MKRVILLKQEQLQEWDTFVEKHPLGLVYHLSEWKRVLEKCFHHIKGHFFALWDSNSKEIVAGIPIYSVRSWVTHKRLVSSPFATISDPLLSSPDDIDMLWPSIQDLYKRIGASYIELKTRHFSFPNMDSNIAVSKPYVHQYLMLNRHPEELKKKFDSNCRRHISKALRSPIALKVGQKEEDLVDFYQIYLKTRKRLGIPPIPYNFFNALWETFGSTDHLTLLLAVHNGKSIAAHLVLKFKEMVIGEVLCDISEFRKFRVNHFLDWEAIKMGYREGYKIFSFGRTSIDNKGLLSFKRDWGTTSDTLLQIVYPMSFCHRLEQKEFSWSYKLIRRISEKTPDPLFHLLGEIVYHHMG